jgi:Holliday junction DNA helicase RuvA
VEGLASEQIPEAGEDVEATLISLGYDELEIRRAIRAIADGASGVPPSGTDQDGWLRSCLQWLSRESA